MSVCSTESVSVSNKAVKCPYCAWEKQGRYLFKHIYQNHYEEIYTSVGTVGKLKEEYDKNLLPKLYQTWEVDQEEYDAEEDKTTIKKIVKERDIWCCFGCSKTFFTNNSCTNHLVKGTTKSLCFKEHREQVNKLLGIITNSEIKGGDNYKWLGAYPEEEIRKGADRYGRGMIWMMESSILPALKKNKLEEKYLKVKEFSGFTPIDPKNIKGKKALIEAYKANAKASMAMVRFCAEFHLEQPHNLCNHEEREHNNDLPEFPEN